MEGGVFWLALVLVTGASGTYMPGPQTHSFLEEFLRSSEPGVRGPLALPNLKYSAQSLNLSLEAREGFGDGPSALVDLRRAEGTVLGSGSVYLGALLHLGHLQMFYNSTKVNFHGLENEGAVGWRLESAVTRLVVEVKTSVFNKCVISLRLEPPDGLFFLLPGSDMGKFFAYLAEFGLAYKKNFTYIDVQKVFGDWALFLPLRDRLQAALEKTANKMFCKYKKNKARHLLF